MSPITLISVRDGLSDQRYAPGALPLGKKPPVHYEQRAGWAPLNSGRFRVKINHLYLRGIEPDFSVVQPIFPVQF